MFAIGQTSRAKATTLQAVNSSAGTWSPSGAASIAAIAGSGVAG